VYVFVSSGTDLNKEMILVTENIQGAVFEVETRFHFKDQDEAFQAVPFLQAGLKRNMEWTTGFYGVEILKSGKVLRKSQVSIDGRTRHFICWKGPDIGGAVNIRQEVNEEVTTGIAGSSVMSILGGPTDLENPEQAVKEIEHLGHGKYMSFSGTDFFGYFKPLDIRVKLMFCPHIDYPLLVELEKIAETEAEAARFEDDIIKICDDLQLRGRQIRKEPPTLLYEKVRAG